MEKVKQFNNTKDLNNYLKYEAKEGEVVELNEVADWTHPKRITRFVKWLKMEDKEIKLREEWKSYVESYNSQTSKKMHLLSCTHVVFKLIEKACFD